MKKEFIDIFSKLFTHVLEERLNGDNNNEMFYLIQNTLIDFIKIHGKKIKEPTGWIVNGYMFNEDDYIYHKEDKLIKGIAINEAGNILVLIVNNIKNNVMELDNPRLSLEIWIKIFNNCLKVWQ